MKKLLVGLLALASISAFSKSNMEKTCQFSVETVDHEIVYARTLAKVQTGLRSQKLGNGYLVNLNATADKNVMTVKYSDINSPLDIELHTLTVRKSGAVKKVIKDVNGDTVVLRLICAYDEL